MTSASDVWVQCVCATDMRGQVNGQYGPGLIRALVGSGWAGLGWALARHVACCGAATSWPWASTRLWSSTVGVSVAHGGPRDAGPWTADRSTVVRVYPSSLRRGPCAPSSRVCGRRGEKSSVSPAAVLSPAASSLVSPRGGVGVQLRRGKVSSRRGDYDGGVKVVAKASQGAGHGERRLEHNRRAGVARVQRHRPGLWCA